MCKEILISRVHGETRIAWLENDCLEQILIERDDQQSLVGNIYKAKVIRVMPGMQAAFVDIGDKRSAILHIDNIYSANNNVKIESILSAGKNILAQVIKDPIKDKGAVLTTDLSIASYSLVYRQNRKKLAISHQIKDKSERERLISLFDKVVSSLVPPKEFSGNFILRSVAEGLTQEQLIFDMQTLHSIWSDLLIKKMAKSPTILYKEPPKFQRMISEMLNKEEVKITVDCPQIHNDLNLLFKQYHVNKTAKLTQNFQQKNLFDRYDLDQQINAALEKDVALNCGGTLIIEETEALSVIDVNSASYTGDNDDQETYLKVNLEAADAAARQIRLRNLSGIIIIDFIDMTDRSSQRQVLKRLQKAFADDQIKPTIFDFTELGLVQIARKRTGLSISQTLCAPCDTYSVKGFIKSVDTVVYEILRALSKEADGASCEKIEIQASKEVIQALQKKYSVQIKQYEDTAECSVKLCTHNVMHCDEFNIIPT